eukprot:scaffold4757_cov93-Skeletonema_dohrnii-CCMP3373.AAC.6
MANYNGSLEAVDWHIHSLGHDIVLECWWLSQTGLHQSFYLDKPRPQPEDVRQLFPSTEELVMKMIATSGLTRR